MNEKNSLVKIVIEGNSKLINGLVSVIRKMNDEGKYDFSFGKVIVNKKAVLTILAKDAGHFYALGIRSANEYAKALSEIVTT